MNSSCGFYLQGSKHTGSWGSYYFGDSWETCSSDYATIFGCTNTTYSDKNGNPGGDTVFVTTDCSTNVRILDPQDPRYVGEAYGFTTLTVADQSAANQGYIGGVGDRAAHASDETCNRGCLCGYSIETPLLASGFSSPTIDSPYDACDCNTTLTEFYGDLALKSGSDSSLLPITKTNLSLLQYYGAIPCNTSLASPGSKYMTNLSVNYNFDGFPPLNPYTWEYIPDGDSRTMLNPYDCFGNLSTIHEIMDNYTFAQISESAGYRYGKVPIQNACQYVVNTSFDDPI